MPRTIQYTIKCAICGVRTLPAFKHFAGPEPVTARQCPKHPFTNTEVVTRDENDIAPKPMVTQKMVDKWAKEDEDRRKREAIAQREEAEVRLQADIRRAFFDANPNATEGDFTALYLGLRNRYMEEQTRTLMGSRAGQPHQDDLLANLKANVHAAFRGLIAGKRTEREAQPPAFRGPVVSERTE